MPFGAQLREDGRVRFRLWAPAATRVELRLGDDAEAGATLAMAVEDDGWFGLVTDLAGPGTLYRYRIDEGREVPDPASRRQPDGVHGPSQVVDPTAWQWGDTAWRGRPWDEAMFYELHVGAFTPEGSFAGAMQRLDYLAELGVSAIELMPVAQFAGSRGWGYDGVQPFAPFNGYGDPNELKALIDAAHACGLMVFLDVVYNHFGPEGNYLHLYAPDFFSERHHTPWGPALNFDGARSHWVRQFFIHNALYWLEEYHVDGLRLDAVHAIVDNARPDILTELAEVVRRRVDSGRQVHLVLENDHNAAHYLAREDRRARWYAAQWNDDMHHALHVLATGEETGYYIDYRDDPMRHLVRCLAEGFAYQGEASAYRDGVRRGEASAALPPAAFVNFLQNHDQVGNRAFGERLSVLSGEQCLRAMTSLLLLAPSPPLVFMGQEWGSRRPFRFFCDFEATLAADVTAGRRREFAHLAEFADPATRERIPDPNAPTTFEDSRVDWSEARESTHRGWLAWHRALLQLRATALLPRLPASAGAKVSLLASHALLACWQLADGTTLRVMANLGAGPVSAVPVPSGQILHATGVTLSALVELGQLPEWSVLWTLDGRPP